MNLLLTNLEEKEIFLSFEIKSNLVNKLVEKNLDINQWLIHSKLIVKLQILKSKNNN